MEQPKLTKFQENIRQYDAINLADDRSGSLCPKPLIELAHKYVSQGYNNFSPVEGVLRLREVIAARVEKCTGRKYHPESQVTITAGKVQAIHTVISMVVKENDEVIVFEPAPEKYVSSVVINGGRPVFVSLKQPGFRIDWEGVKRLINPKTKLIIINSPHNPTGSILSDDDMLKLQKLISGTNICILSDEEFSPVVFDNQTHHSVAGYEKLAEKSFLVSSYGPIYNINGWNLAYCLASEKLMAEFRKIHEAQVYNVNTPLQYAMAEFLETDDTVGEISYLYQGKRNYLNRLLSDSFFKTIIPMGGYYQLLDYSEISDENDNDFAMRLLKTYGVATVPLSAFYHEKSKSRLLRICFARSNEVLEKAAEKLKTVPVLV